MRHWRGLAVVSLVFLAGCLSGPVGDPEPPPGVTVKSGESSASQAPNGTTENQTPPNATRYVNYSDQIVLVEEEFTYTNPTLGPLGLLPIVGKAEVATLTTFNVDTEMAHLLIDVARSESPDIELSAPSIRITDPNGNVTEWELDDQGAGGDFLDPAPGDWRLDYVVEPVEPGAKHVLDVLVLETSIPRPHEYHSEDDPAPSAAIAMLVLLACVIYRRR